MTSQPESGANLIVSVLILVAILVVLPAPALVQETLSPITSHRVHSFLSKGRNACTPNALPVVYGKVAG